MTSREDLAAILTTAGTLPSAWADAFAAVDRAAFVPDLCWFDDENGDLQPLGRDTDPDRWRATVYSDEPIVTQLDEGRVIWPAVSPLITSSASQPSMVATMLDALNVRDSDRVLEIGTGTGYNAALLAHRLGDSRVTTIEVDPALVEQARASLADAVYKPLVVCGDGAAGWPDGAPYDRVIATAAVIAGRLPYAWVTQLRPGGVILTPWGTAFRNGVLVRLTVQDDGTASGPVIGDAAFMRLRDQDTPYGHADRLADLALASDDMTTTTVRPDDVATGDGAFVTGLHLPDVQRSVTYDDPEHYEVLLYHVPTDSAAVAVVAPEHASTYPVRQHGPRRLWDEAETAYAWWASQGRPTRVRFGLTITPDGEHVWLDQPTNKVITA